MDDSEERSTLPALLPLPPLSSNNSTTIKSKPVGTVHPYIHTPIDPLSLTLKTLPPKQSITLSATSLDPTDDRNSQDHAFPPDHLLRKPVTSPTRPLPQGKKWHIFISHSTSDQPLIRQSLVVPLRDMGRMVTACYHYMPDSSRYNDKDILDAMEESCFILICISPAYVSSGR